MKVKAYLGHTPPENDKRNVIVTNKKGAACALFICREWLLW